MSIFLKTSNDDSDSTSSDSTKETVTDSSKIPSEKNGGKELSPETQTFAKNLGKLNQYITIVENTYKSLDSIVEERLKASFNKQLTINPDPCNYNIDEDDVVSPQEATEAVQKLIDSAHSYMSALQKKLDFLNTGSDMVQNEINENPTEAKALMKTDLSIEGQKADTFNTINTLNTKIEITIRRRQQFLVLLPIKMELLDCMLDTCNWENKSKKTKSIIGFINSEELTNLEFLYTRAIDILKRYKTKLASVNPQSALINKNIDNTITSFEIKKNDLYKDVMQRLVPGFGSPGSAK